MEDSSSPSLDTTTAVHHQQGQGEPAPSAVEEEESVLSSNNNYTTSEGAPSSSTTNDDNDDDLKSSLRSPHTRRQTVEDLETKAACRHEKGNGVRNSPFASSSKPGAVAVQAAFGLSRQRHNNSTTSTTRRVDSSSTNRNTTQATAAAAASNEHNDVSVSCQPATTANDVVDNDVIPMIHAQLAPPLVTEEPIMIHAELVVPPPRAHIVPMVEHVQFDEEAPPPPLAGYQPPTTNTSMDLDDDDDEDSITKMKQFWSRHSKQIWQCHVLLLVVGLVLAIAVPRIQQQQQQQQQEYNRRPTSPGKPGGKGVWDDNHNILTAVEDDEFVMEHLFDDQVATTIEHVLNPVPAPTPAPSALSVYDCYQSTYDIIMAQLNITLAQEDRTFIICPNTKIPLGTFDATHNRIEGGDYPLVAITDSVEIRCGLDGRRDNQCVLDGGFLQVLLHPSLPGDELAAMANVNRTDNVVFRGITFTGTIDDSSSAGSSGSSNTERQNSLGGVSVLVNNPGQNITFVDCAWENVVAPQGLVQIGDKNNPWGGFAPTTEVNFQDCLFHNIIYDRGPLIGVYGQGVAIRQSFFHNVRLPPNGAAAVAKNDDSNQYGGGVHPCSSAIGDGMEWCHGLVYCFERSQCELEDICVDDLEYAGPAAIAAASFKTNLTVSGSKHVVGVTMHPSFVASSSSSSNSNAATTTSTMSSISCSSELARYTDANYQQIECVSDDLGNWTTWANSTCVL